MFSPSDFNTAVPQFTNGNYASNPLNPLYIEEPSAIDYNRGVEPLQTLPAQWWNWLGNQFTAKLNKINLYVKNIFDELTQLLSLVGMTPDATEGSITTNQLKTAFTGAYPNYISKFMHTLAEAWSYIGTTVVGDVTTTQTDRLAVFEHVNVSDASTTPATETDTYKTKYIDKLPIVLGGTGGSTAQEAMTNLSTPLPTINVNTGLITDAVLFERESGGARSVQKMTMDEVGRIVSSTRVNVPVIVTNSTTINSANLEINDSIRIVFTADITGSDTSTALELTYNNSVMPIKVPKNGSLVGLYAHELYEGGVYVYKYLQAYTALDLYYDGTNFVLLENPIVLSSTDYTIYADGKIGGGEIGDIKIRTTTDIPYGWLECNGQSVLRSDYPDLFEKFNTQTYDSDPTHTLLSRFGYVDASHFNLPDYREIALVGCGTNDKDSIATHETYTLGEFKDDQFQSHGHSASGSFGWAPGSNGSSYYVVGAAYSSQTSPSGTYGVSVSVSSPNSGRNSTVTRGKRKGAMYLIKVL